MFHIHSLQEFEQLVSLTSTIKRIKRECINIVNNGYTFELIQSHEGELNLFVTTKNGIIYHFHNFNNYPFSPPSLNIDGKSFYKILNSIVTDYEPIINE